MSKDRRAAQLNHWFNVMVNTQGNNVDDDKRTTFYHDLDNLAGTWTAEDEAAFNTAIQPLEAIDPELWT